MEVNRTSHVVKYPQKTPSAAFMGIILKYKQNSVHSVDYFNFFVYYFYSYFFFSLKNGEKSCGKWPSKISQSPRWRLQIDCLFYSVQKLKKHLIYYHIRQEKKEAPLVWEAGRSNYFCHFMHEKWQTISYQKCWWLTFYWSTNE